MNNNYLLLIACPDAKGLIYRITSVLYDKNCNIISNGEFVDVESSFFFMRTEFSGTVDENEILLKLKKDLPADSEIKLSRIKKKNMVILVSREHHCLGDLLIRHKYGELNSTISAVVGNHSNLEGLCRSFDVPFFFVGNENKSRSDFEYEIINILDKLLPECIVLAKFMRILSPEFVNHYRNRIINIHHSFLPAFPGASPYRRAFERGVKIIGATAHFVTEMLDEGPIISQGVINIDHTHSVEDMTLAGMDVEKIVLARALNLVLEDRVFVNGNKTVIFD